MLLLLTFLAAVYAWNYAGTITAGDNCDSDLNLFSSGAPTTGKEFIDFCYGTGANDTFRGRCKGSSSSGNAAGDYTIVNPDSFVMECDGVSNPPVCCTDEQSCGSQVSPQIEGKACCRDWCGDQNPTQGGGGGGGGDTQTAEPIRWDIVGAVLAGIFSCIIGTVVLASTVALCIFCAVHFRKLKHTPIFWEEDENDDSIPIMTISEFKRSGYDISSSEDDELEDAPMSSDFASSSTPVPSMSADSPMTTSSPSAPRGPKVEIDHTPTTDKAASNFGISLRKTETREARANAPLPAVVPMREVAQLEIVRGASNPRPNSVGKYYNFGNLRNAFEKSPPAADAAPAPAPDPIPQGPPPGGRGGRGGRGRYPRGGGGGGGGRGGSMVPRGRGGNRGRGRGGGRGRGRGRVAPPPPM